MNEKYHKSRRVTGITKIIALTLIICLMLISNIYNIDLSTSAAASVITDPAAVEPAFRQALQTGFDSMLSTVIFKAEGVAAAKKILKTDTKGNIVIVNGKFEIRPEFLDIFSRQLIAMSANNNNAYNRLAMSGWSLEIPSITCAIDDQNVVTQIKLELVYKITWHDGANALAARTAVENHANAFLSSTEYKSKTTDYDKLKAINNYIFKTFQYDYRVFVKSEFSNTIYTAYGMISDSGAINNYPRGVCQAYAMYGYIMLKKAGYDNITIDGHAPIPPAETPDINPHVWNMIKLGSLWYHIDFTWNDPISAGNPSPYNFRQFKEGDYKNSENYLLRSDNEILINHRWQSIQDGFNYYIASKKWSGTPEIINVTQPPAPTVSPMPKPTKANTPAPSRNSVQSIASSSSEPQQSVSKDAKLKSVKISSISIDADNTNSSAPNNAKANNNNNKTPQTVNISGIITDEKGVPVSNRTIELYATARTTQTEKNGFYEFKGILPGNYKIYIKDQNGTEITQLPVVISLGENTEQFSGTVYVKGENLVMDLMLTGKVLSIKNISSPNFQFSIPMIIVTAIIIIGVLIALSILLFKKKQDDLNWDYLK